MPTRRRLDAATGAEARLRRAAALVTLVAWHAVDFGVFASTEEGGGRLERSFAMELELKLKRRRRPRLGLGVGVEVGVEATLA